MRNARTSLYCFFLFHCRFCFAYIRIASRDSLWLYFYFFSLLLFLCFAFFFFLLQLRCGIQRDIPPRILCCFRKQKTKQRIVKKATFRIASRFFPQEIHESPMEDNGGEMFNLCFRSLLCFSEENKEKAEYLLKVKSPSRHSFPDLKTFIIIIIRGRGAK